MRTTNPTRSAGVAPVAAAALLATLAGECGAQDTRPAPFPDKAHAVLVQGSSETRFKNDINRMETVLTHTDNRWQYGSVGKLLWDGSGDGRSNWANVGKAIDAAGRGLWGRSPGEQNFVYVHSSHGLEIDAKNSKMAFGRDGYRTSDDLVGAIVSKLPDGHKEFSLRGATETTCVRTMTYVLEPCYSGGQIWDLTTALADKQTRRRHFPALSDITVMTAGDSNECTTANGDDTGNSFMQAFYGYGRVAGALQGADARSAWSVFKDAAEKTDVNPNEAYTPNSSFGTGNNAVMYVKGQNHYGGAEKDYPLYRHVQFYPAITFGDGPDGRVPVPGGGVGLDFTLGGISVPLSGAVPITMSINDSTAGSLNVDRDIRPETALGGLPADEGWFLDYYSFDLTPSTDLSFGSADLFLSVERDDFAPWIDLDDVRLFNHDGRGWVDTGADFDRGSLSFSLSGYDRLGTFAVVVPTPGGVTLLSIAAAISGRRRRVH